MNDSLRLDIVLLARLVDKTYRKCGIGDLYLDCNLRDPREVARDLERKLGDLEKYNTSRYFREMLSEGILIDGKTIKVDVYFVDPSTGRIKPGILLGKYELFSLLNGNPFYQDIVKYQISRGYRIYTIARIGPVENRLAELHVNNNIKLHIDGYGVEKLTYQLLRKISYNPIVGFKHLEQPNINNLKK